MRKLEGPVSPINLLVMEDILLRAEVGIDILLVDITTIMLDIMLEGMRCSNIVDSRLVEDNLVIEGILVIVGSLIVDILNIQQVVNNCWDVGTDQGIIIEGMEDIIRETIMGQVKVKLVAVVLADY